MVDNLRSLGIEVWEYQDGYEFSELGKGKMSSELDAWLSGKGGKILTRMDHRIAMSFLILKTLTGLPLEIDETSWIETSFPGFEEKLGSVLV